MTRRSTCIVPTEFKAKVGKLFGKDRKIWTVFSDMLLWGPLSEEIVTIIERKSRNARCRIKLRFVINQLFMDVTYDPYKKKTRIDFQMADPRKFSFFERVFHQDMINTFKATKPKNRDGDA